MLILFTVIHIKLVMRAWIDLTFSNYISFQINLEILGEILSGGLFLLALYIESVNIRVGQSLYTDSLGIVWAQLLVFFFQEMTNHLYTLVGLSLGCRAGYSQ